MNGDFREIGLPTPPTPVTQDQAVHGRPVGLQQRILLYSRMNGSCLFRSGLIFASGIYMHRFSVSAAREIAVSILLDLGMRRDFRVPGTTTSVNIMLAASIPAMRGQRSARFSGTASKGNTRHRGGIFLSPHGVRERVWRICWRIQRS